MKVQVSRLALTALLVLVSLLAVPRNSAAATHPLNYPYGLAVASNGNLYVANTNGNEVLIYSPAHVQLTAKTITTNVSGPSAVAFDLSGNLWVANSTGNSITEYAPNGTSLPSGTITAGVSNPVAMTFDGIGDLWVNNGYTGLAVYPAFASSPAASYTPGTFTGIASHQMWIVFGTNSADFRFEVFNIAKGTFIGEMQSAPTCYAMAYDSLNNLYCGNEDDSLTVMDSSGNLKTVVQNLGFFPTGLALDSTRKLIYVANGPGNSIAVYSLSGALVATIQ